MTHGLILLNVATLSLLVDLKVIEREAVVSRLQEFLDTMPEEPRNGIAGLLLRSVIKMFQPGAPLPDPKTLFEVIDGGLPPRDQGQRASSRRPINVSGTSYQSFLHISIWSHHEQETHTKT